MMSRSVILPAGIFWALVAMATAAVAQVSDYELAENFKHPMESWSRRRPGQPVAPGSYRCPASPGFKGPVQDPRETA